MGLTTSVTSFGRSGLSDWLLQRVTAVVLAAYVIFLAGYLLINSDLQYEQWVALHSHFCMKVFNVMAVLSVAVHAWIGLWAVLTDYVTVRLMGPKATPIRIVLQLAMIAVIFVYVLWAIDILWGI
ncbi:MAG: succinate dehydrogenase, hydrophobic membrane anchor protein [Porticoccaceae bacterium]|nr:succinate dehydrogenase, hydrophobic membrane anchor protein [Pseudomonadales bacterium]MCP5171676.1 succinate dehydrogenase, hydrophobic membrane anchor protein [Pseudomonadales bacterium]